MDINPTLIALAALVMTVMWAYGRVKYNEGKAVGTTTGTLTGALQIIVYFKQKKVVDHDSLGNIFRLKDDGLRGECVLPVDEVSKSETST